MDKLCRQCQALRLPFYEGDNMYTKILFNQPCDREDCVKILLELGADVNSKGIGCGTALVYATRSGHVRRMQALIAAGTDVNRSYYASFGRFENALTAAVDRDNIECVKLLIKAGATVNKVGDKEQSILNLAIERLDTACVNILIEAGANVNDSVTPPLHSAVKRSSITCIDVLMKSGADVNATVDLLKTTALMLVQDVKCCQLLLIYGAQINITDRHGYNALTYYMSHSDKVDKDVCSLLYAAGETTPEKLESRVPSGGNKTINVVDYLPQIQIKFYLKYLCREAIRKHLLNLDPHTHLFGRISRLGLDLPKSLIEYLLFYMSLDSAWPPSKDQN